MIPFTKNSTWSPLEYTKMISRHFFLFCADNLEISTVDPHHRWPHGHANFYFCNRKSSLTQKSLRNYFSLSRKSILRKQQKVAVNNLMTLSLYNIIGMKMKHLKMKSNNVKILHCFGALITLTVKKLRQYQVGNTISRKITWMGDHSSVEVDAV